MFTGSSGWAHDGVAGTTAGVVLFFPVLGAAGAASFDVGCAGPTATVDVGAPGATAAAPGTGAATGAAGAAAFLSWSTESCARCTVRPSTPDTTASWLIRVPHAASKL